MLRYTPIRTSRSERHTRTKVGTEDRSVRKGKRSPADGRLTSENVAVIGLRTGRQAETSGGFQTNRSFSASLTLGCVKTKSRRKAAVRPDFIATATVLMTSLDSGQNSVHPRIRFVRASITAFNRPSVSPMVRIRGIEATAIRLTRTSRLFRRAVFSVMPMCDNGGSMNTE